MIVRATRRRDFYQGIVRIFLEHPLTAPPEQLEGAVYSYLRGAWRQYQMLAIAVLDLGFEVELARRYLAESASAGVELQKRTGKSSSPEVLQTLFRIGVCRDPRAARAFSAGYLETPEGRRGAVSVRMMAPTPAPDDHWWHLANALALFHRGSADELTLALDELASLPPRKQFARSAEWWSAIVRLAVLCLAAPTPDPFVQLGLVAEVNQRMFARDDRDLFYEAWFAELAMSFASAAAQRGWLVPGEDPHPSMPLRLLTLAPIDLPPHRWSALSPVDPALVSAIQRSAAGRR